VVTNLLANAIQYGDPSRPVRIALDGEHPDRVVLRVTNDGAPIPPELLTHIFDPFRRAAAGRTRGAGVGLGLYIAERIVSAHGGHISVRSDQADGTTFTVELYRRALSPS
jgi:signal transduction histidine kinase